ncbi:phage tail domain-containing protein [Virgibacillus siamensis]|uniref:phage tail domain-containing protein n=1 Tax=Virgibacillus siamensis TaxID=480071 RepID=UPI0009842EFA|nr:phage tail domain-containing protein [Virgibacillus siamensis]
MDLHVTKKNMSFNLEDYGIRVVDFIVQSIPLQSTYGNVEGRNGTIDYGATYGQRTIKVPFHMESTDLLDFPLLRDQLFGLIAGADSFYINERRKASYQPYKFETPGQEHVIPDDFKNVNVDGKRYLVRLKNVIELEQMIKHGSGELEFATTVLPFAESAGTTEDIDKNGIDPASGFWTGDMGIIPEMETVSYSPAMWSDVGFKKWSDI